MNIDHCNNVCRCGDVASAATPAGIQLLRQALDLLGRPEVVHYTDIADAFTRKDENGEPPHTDGYQAYLDLGTVITCDCVLHVALRECAYADISVLGEYVRETVA